MKKDIVVKGTEVTLTLNLTELEILQRAISDMKQNNRSDCWERLEQEHFASDMNHVIRDFNKVKRAIKDMDEVIELAINRIYG